ncbi:MAG: extracellular solute-binding protein [Deltaproteobacteria bacterium]|nr:extracellular solute-binding protein [Deltaproteobacteria bacterium]
MPSERHSHGLRRLAVPTWFGLVLLLTIAPGPAAAQRVEVALWHSYRAQERSALEETVRQLNTELAGLRVKATFVPYDAFLDKVTNAIPHGHGPDIFIAAHDRIGGWADSGHIAPLDGYISDDVTRRFFKKTIDPLTYRRKVYGLPTAFKSAALFYNKALMANPPRDTDEMIAAARGFVGKTQAEGQPIYGLVWQHSDLYFHACWLYGFRGQLFDSARNLTLDHPGNIESFRFVHRLVSELKLAPEDVTSIKVTSLFNSGRAAMVINGPWFRGEIAPGVDYGVALLPEIGASGVRAQPFVGSEAFLLSARSAHPEQAYAAMEWLTRDAAAERRMVEGFQPVANMRCYDAQQARSDPVLMVFREQLKHAVPMRNSPEMRMVWVPMNHALVNTVTGRATPEQALAEAQLRTRIQIEEFRKGQALKEAGSNEGELARAVGWGIGGGLLTLLGFIAVFWRRFKRMMGEAWQEKSAYAYISPAMLAILLLVFVPFVAGLGLSLFRYYQGEYFYVGGKNFVDILASREYAIDDPFSFYYKLFITIVWTGANVVLHVAMGLGLALLLKNPLLKLKGLYRVLLIIPWAIPNYITAIIWRGMFDADDGVINHMLGIEGYSWWQSTPSAFVANLITNCWLGFPFMMVVALGALQSIPRDLYEAADVDGASRWGKFRHITLPLLKPALFPAIILGTIWTFNMFNIIYLVSRGAPNGGTDILVIEAFRWAFERGDRYGYAAAYSTLIFVILFLYTLMTNRITRATEGAFD